MAKPGNKERANLKIQIRNAQDDWCNAADNAEFWIETADDLDEKIKHLEKKLAKLSGAKSGENKKQKP